MVRHGLTVVAAALAWAGLGRSECPLAGSSHLTARDEASGSRSQIAQSDVDGKGFMNTDGGGPVSDQHSLKAGPRGPTLLEDFIFRRKITHFDHERVPERAVHARGAGAYGTFTSYGSFSNITAASFLSAEGKKTNCFVRFSTVAGSRGSADTVRDVHGFATRFYTDEGNFDLVGNNIPVFFIQDAIQFPDLIHAVKPNMKVEIPTAATAHDEAWDFFSQQPSTLHTLMWAMAGYGIPRSYRHMDGFGVHTFRLVNDKGDSKLVKWIWKSMQGKASLVWEEAQHISGNDADYHRRDLSDAITAGNFPEWELNVQVIDEDQALAFGFDVLDPTKIIPEELAPLQKLGKLQLNANPVNYFSETEQIMYQVGNVVRGIDFTEDPLLQGRIFSYLDTQLNRAMGSPNFEQIPINRPAVAVVNNNRDGAGQMLIHKNTAAYSPNTLNNGFPAQANQTVGDGFFTAPGRQVRGPLTRELSPTFADHWSQPRLFLNSITAEEMQMVVNAIRFETSQIQPSLQKQVLVQLNRISNDLATRVGAALGMDAPAPDPKFYHNNRTQGLSIFGVKLPTIAAFKVGVLTSMDAPGSLAQAKALREAMKSDKVDVVTVGERLADGVDMTYSTAAATAFDAIVVADGAQALFSEDRQSTLFPSGRPMSIVSDGYRWGKPMGFVGGAQEAAKAAGVKGGAGVYQTGEVAQLAKNLAEGLATFKFTDRFAMDGRAKNQKAKLKHMRTG
ncbi:hypothetical protein L249_2177 [Ophiocordyceps polyrhachis-furcata BCC 54312]|uniref:Catalase n=1 Tax=Ophiocordyceps polyrhachis-furcata BCC 54312 TaxID=1330021 RepID=A0A367LPG5_9HYPO|nr:hypothetical protein L249_2177 [Ophiocordyceps polyrhachis-furcata BCC 54312]